MKTTTIPVALALTIGLLTTPFLIYAQEEGSMSGQKVHKQQGEQAQKGLTKGAEGQGQPQKAAATDKGTAPSSRDGHDAREDSHQEADEGSH